MISIKNLSALAVAALLVHSYIHLTKTVSTNRARNFDSSPDFATFLNKNKAWLKSFASEN